MRGPFRSIDLSIFIRLAFFGILTFVMFSCSPGGSPREVADQFLTHMGKNEFDKAMDVSTAETDRLLEMMEGFERMSESGAVKERKFEIIELKSEGNTAKVTYVEVGREKVRREFMLVKEEGKWLVSADKSMLSGSPDGTLNIGGTSTQPE
jgi:hypothetical protein